MEEKKLTIQEEWLLTKKISVKYSTYCKYESIVTKHINPYLKENNILKYLKSISHYFIVLKLNIFNQLNLITSLLH